MAGCSRDEIGQGKAFGKIAVGGRQCRVSLDGAILTAPEPRQACRGPQLPRAALLTASGLDRALEALLGGWLISRLGQQQFALETQQLGFLKTLVVFFHEQ